MKNMSRWGNILVDIRSYDWALFSLVIALSALGLSAQYSVDLSRGGGIVRFVPTQIIAVALGLIIMFVGGALRPSIYFSAASLSYIAGLALLVAVLFFGETIRGTTGWFRLGGFSFQPAEFAKFSVALALAFFIHRAVRRFDRPQFIVGSGAIVLFPSILIMIQPDLGSSILIIALWLCLMVLTVPKKRSLLVILALGILSAVTAWFLFLKPYQKERVLTFLSPERDPLGAGYNVAQSLIAIGAGQWFGRGLGFGSQSQLRFLPEAHTDFIFSVIAEELGFAGSILTISLLGGLSYRMLVIARSSGDDFGAYVALSGAIVFFLHTIFNFGAATGLLPVTGVPLPFVSYGGSSYLGGALLIAVAQSVFRSRRHLSAT